MYDQIKPLIAEEKREMYQRMTNHIHLFVLTQHIEVKMLTYRLSTV